MGHYEKAMHHYRKAEAIHPNFGPLQNNIGLILLKQRSFREAEIRFQKALKYQADLPEALSNLGLLFILKGDLSQALDMLKKAIHIDPNSHSALMRISRVYMELKRYDEALNYARKALENDSNNHLGLLFLAQIYHASGNDRKTKQTIQKLFKSIQLDRIPHLIESFDDPKNLDALLFDKDFAISWLAETSKKR
jgi:Tfp pilus assembly protein PilF